jgi:hypothetical protein
LAEGGIARGAHRGGATTADEIARSFKTRSFKKGEQPYPIKWNRFAISL